MNSLASDTAALHISCVSKHSIGAQFRIMSKLSAAAWFCLETALAFAIKNPAYSTYKTESFAFHWTNRSQLVHAIKQAGLSCLQSAAETLGIAVVVSIATFDRPRFARAIEFNRCSGRDSQQVKGALVVFDRLKRATSSLCLPASNFAHERHVPAYHPGRICELKSAAVSSFADPDSCIHDAIQQLLRDSPKHLKNLPEFLGLISASGIGYLTYIGYSHLKRQFPPDFVVEAAARRFNLHGCNALLCATRLAMRAHGVLAIVLIECSSTLDGDGFEENSNPGIYRLQYLVSELLRHASEAQDGYLAVLHRRTELKLLMRFVSRLHHAVQRCLPQISGVLSSATIEDIRHRINAAAAAVDSLNGRFDAADEEYFINSTSNLLNCIAHIGVCIRSIPSPRHLVSVLSMRDLIWLFLDCELQARPCLLVLPLLHHIRTGPWSHDSSNVAQFSRQFLTALADFSPVFFVLREILFGRADDFRLAVIEVLGPINEIEVFPDSGCAHSILSFFKNIIADSSQSNSDASPLIAMIREFAIQLFTRGILHSGDREASMISWLQHVSYGQLFALLLRRMRDIDEPLRLFGLCAHVALKFVVNMITSCAPVSHTRTRVLNCLKRFVSVAESLDLLHPNWSFLRIFDWYKIACSAVIYAFESRGPVPSSDDSRIFHPNFKIGRGHLFFKFGDGVKHLSPNHIFLRNRAFKVIVRRAILAADAADSDSRLCVNVFWTEGVQQHLRYIENILRAYLPADHALTPISSNHPALASCSEGSHLIPEQKSVLQVLKNHNDSVHCATQADFVRPRFFFRRCCDLFQLSHRKRSLAAALSANKGEWPRAAAAAAAADRDVSLAQQVLSQALAAEGAYCMGVVKDICGIIDDFSRHMAASESIHPLECLRASLLKYPQITGLSQRSITVRQIIELIEHLVCVISYKTEEGDHVQPQQNETHKQQLWIQYEQWQKRRHQVPHQSSAYVHSNNLEPLRALDVKVAWFLVCDVMRIFGEGAKFAELHQQQHVGGGFLKSILHFINTVTDYTYEDFRNSAEHDTNASKSVAKLSSPAMKSAPPICSSKGSQHRVVLAPHLAEFILERPQSSKLLLCVMEFAHVLSNIELHLNSKIPVVMIERIAGEIFSISSDEHSHLYDLLDQIGRKEDFVGVKESYDALSLGQLSIGVFSALVAATLIPFNVVLTQLYFDVKVAERADIVPLAYPFAFTFGAGGAAGSGLYFFVKQCRADSAIGELNVQFMILKILGAALLFWVVGLFAGRALEAQEVATEFLTCIFVMIAGAVAATTVFVRNLKPVLRYGSRLVGM
jgi:hypothetical protein